MKLSLFAFGLMLAIGSCCDTARGHESEAESHSFNSKELLARATRLDPRIEVNTKRVMGLCNSIQCMRTKVIGDCERCACCDEAALVNGNRVQGEKNNINGIENVVEGWNNQIGTRPSQLNDLGKPQHESVPVDIIAQPFTKPTKEILDAFEATPVRAYKRQDEECRPERTYSESESKRLPRTKTRLNPIEDFGGDKFFRPSRGSYRWPK